MSLSLKPITRIPTADKAIKSPLLNRLGVQVFRTVAARSMFHLKGTPPVDGLKDKVEELRREGMVVFENFLEPAHFEQLRAECIPFLDQHKDEAAILKHGPNTLRKITLSSRPAGELPATEKFFADPRLHTFLAAAEKRPFNAKVSHTAIEQLIQGPEEIVDPETILHSDIFFDNHKAWLYLTDVTLDDGPFVFVKRSHHITLTQLGYIYRESCRNNGGSRRISSEELRRQGLEETVLTCPKNTLVVGNTYGYHRRLRGKPGHERYAVHASLRVNPFFRWFR